MQCMPLLYYACGCGNGTELPWGLQPSDIPLQATRIQSRPPGQTQAGVGAVLAYAYWLLPSLNHLRSASEAARLMAVFRVVGSLTRSVWSNALFRDVDA